LQKLIDFYMVNRWEHDMAGVQLIQLWLLFMIFNKLTVMVKYSLPSLLMLKVLLTIFPEHNYS